jgi:hypothetical protein
MSKLHTLLLFVLLPFFLWAQTDTLPATFEEDIIESFFLSQEEENNSFDYNTAFEELEFFLKRPLDLNQATLSDLEIFPFLNDIQRQTFIDYRAIAGGLVSIYELQAIPGFDMTTIARILPYVQVKPASGLRDFSLKNLKTDSKNMLMLRSSRTLEKSKGFSVPVGGTSSRRYLGDRNSIYLRFHSRLSSHLSLGLTAEKDPGEEFFRDKNRQGFDFYSAHIAWSNPANRLKTLVLGDFSISMGQGLISWQGFGAGKSAMSTSIARTARRPRPYTSVSEFDFFRGGAATVSLIKNLDLTAFASFRKRDGNLVETTQQDLEPEEAIFTSLQTSGLHRTDSETDDENAIGQTTFGSVLKFTKKRWHIALNGLFSSFDKPLVPTPKPYNRYYFSGDQLLNHSIDYAFTHKNLHFFGETALGDNGALATLNGALIALDRKIDVALLHRHFAKNFQSLHGSPFAETSGARNESGMYLGIDIRPARAWRLNVYYDMWRHDWLRFNTDAPSIGNEWLVRLTWTIRKKMEAYLQVRHELKELNEPDNDSKIDRLVSRKNLQLRLHLSYKLNRDLEWRSRLDAGYSKMAGNRYNGTSLFQDLIYKPLGSPFSFTTRFAIFDTDAYDVRFYSFENSLLNDYSFPAYFNRGIRYYLNVRYRATRQLTLEARLARTRYTDGQPVGSDLDEISSGRRTDVKFQVRWQF